MKINKKIIMLVLLPMFGVFALENSTSAFTTVEQKALGYGGIYRCYTGSDIVINEIELASVNNYEKVIGSSSDEYVPLPNGFKSIHEIEDNNVSCRALIGGTRWPHIGGSMKGLLERADINQEPADSTDKKKLLTALGYTAEEGGSGGQCFKFKYVYGSMGNQYVWNTAEGETAAVCSKNGGVTKDDISVDNNTSEVTKFSLDGSILTMKLWTAEVKNQSMGGGYTSTENVYDEKKYDLGNYSSFTALSDAVFSDYSAYYGGEGKSANSNGTPPMLARRISLPDADIRETFPYGERVGDTYALKPTRESGALEASKNLLGATFSNKDDMAFSAQEEYDLYSTYYKDYYEAKLQCDYGAGQSATEDSLKNQGYSKIEGGALAECYVKAEKNKDKKVYGLNEAKFFDGTELDFEQLISAYSASAEAADKSREDVINDIASDTTELSPDAQAEVTCQNSGGAGSLGWIVCSILDWMANATEFMYDNIVEPALRIEPELFTTTGGQGQNAEAAWRIFRDFANIIFIILLLIVIFSQLTGYGIDNYGIKKILPKLIVVAVLVNLSYLICLICVDLSNIVGNGIQDVFNGMTGQISANITIDPLNGALPAGATSNVAVDVGARAGIAAVTIAGLAVGAYALYSNPALLLTLFISVLGVLISVLFVFILLAGRKAAIVLLTVVSPIAFILYMLPNTKKIYDKWFNLWKAMLLVYPICGLLIGGGNFASQLMLGIGQNTSTPAASVFTAMIVGIVPIFFIPTVIKSAYAALGSIGGTLAGFGGRLRGGFTRGARNNELYKNVQKRGIEGGIRRKAGYDSNGNRAWGEEGPNRFQRFIRGGKKNIQRNALAYRKLQSEQGALDATNGAEFMLETETANVAQSIVASGDINSIDTMRNKLKDAIRKENRAEIRAYTDALAGKGKNGRKAIKKAYNETASTMTDVAAKAFADNLVNKHGSAFKENDRSMYEVASKINQSGVASGETTQHYLDHGGREALAGKLSAETIGDMDNDAIKEIFGSFDGSTVNIPVGDAELQKQIGAAAQKALSSGTVKDVTRQTLLQKITEKTGYTAPPTNVVMGNSQPQSQHQQPEIIVPENERAAEAALQEELRKRHQNGGGAKGSSGNNNVSPGGVILS